MNYEEPDEFKGELKQVPGLLLHFRTYFTVHRGRVYTIMVSAPARVWKQATPHWRKVIESMEFL